MHDCDHRIGALLSVASAVAFATMAIFGKLAFEAGVGVLTVLFLRFVLAAGALWLVIAALRAMPRAPRRVLAIAFGMGAAGYATQAGLFFFALERMDASLLALLLYTYPAMVTAGTIVLGRESASAGRIGALLVSSIGLVLVLAGAGRGELDVLGVAMGIGAAVTYTSYLLVSHHVTDHISPLPLTGLVMAGASVTVGVIAIASGEISTDFEPVGWLWLLGIALVSTVSAVILFFMGMKRVGASTAAILSTFEPPVTVLLAFLAFGEALTAVQLAGGLLVLAAVAILHVRPPAPQPA